MIKIINNIFLIRLKRYFIKVRSDVKERNRFMMISLSLLFILDYLMFCFISDRNPLKIFPSIPLLNNEKSVNIYLPNIDGKHIFKEKREISIPDTNEGFALSLIEKIIRGSVTENTSIAVPADIFIRKIWFYKDTCVIDMVPSLPDDKTNIIQGSEKVFKESIKKTITENTTSVKKIVLLERGIPGRNLWE